MAETNAKVTKYLYFIAFCILTIFCWCPIGYGTYGPVNRIAGMPDWAVITFIVSIVFFILQWIYLFQTDLAIKDDELEGIFHQLSEVNTK
jgi:uncharacterized membrane protein YdbT with pleckstrin-like domain